MTTHDEDKIIAQQARIEQLTNFIKYAQVSSGVCCCGDSMEGHPSPMTCGHSPVDMWDYHSGELLEAYPDDLSALRAHDEKLRAAFQAGAASRDAEVAMWVERVNSWTRDCERLADERDQLRTEMNEWRGQAHRSQSDADRLKEENDQLRAQINVLREALSKTLARRLCYEIAGQTDEEVDRQTGAIGNNWR